MIEYVVGTAAALAFVRISRQVYRNHLRPKLKGYLGEHGVNHNLRKLESEGAVLLHDLLLSTGRDTTQIDHVFVSRYGIFYVETKNYSGLISGKEWDKEWTQLTKTTLHPVPNPVRQNYKHSLALKKALTEYPQVPIYPIVVFSNKSRLDVTSEGTLVVNRKDLLSGIAALSRKPVLSDTQVQHIQKLLTTANILDRGERRKHKARARISKELFGAEELSKAYEEGKHSPIVSFSSQTPMLDRILQEKLDAYHAQGPCLTIRGHTGTIDSFLRNAQRNADNSIAAPGTPADHMVCPYTGTTFPISELPQLERGLWLSYFSKNPELAEYITTKEGFSELFPSRSRGASIASAYVKAPASFTALAKRSAWYQNLEQSLRKPAVDTQIQDAAQQGTDDVSSQGMETTHESQKPLQHER